MTTLLALVFFLWAPNGGSQPTLVAQAPANEEGGWGGKIERDRWGDEEIQNQSTGKTHRKDSPLEPSGDTRVQSRTPSVAPTPAAASQKNGSSAPDGGSGKVDNRLENGTGQASLKGGQEAVRPPSGSIDDLSAIWDQRRVHQAQRELELARKDLEKALRLQDELGLRNLEVPAQVLIREAGRAEQRGDWNEAVSLLKIAAQVAPDLPAVYRARAELCFFQNPWEIDRWSMELLDSIKVWFINPLNQNRLFVNLIVVLTLGIGLMAAIFVVVQMLRYLRLFLHDLHHIFPYGVARFQTIVVGVLLLLLPILFRLGPLVTLMCWLMAAWLYQTWSARIVSLIVVGFLALTPIAVYWMVDQLVVLGSRNEDLLAIERGAAPHQSLDRISNALEKTPEDLALLATMARYHKRVFELEKAHNLYDRALLQKPNSEILLNNLGNVLYLEGNIDGALLLYQRATKIRPNLAVPYYNLSTLYFNKLDLNRGKEAHAQAQRLNSSIVYQLEQKASAVANHSVADMPLPDEWLVGVSITEDVRQKDVDALWQAWGGFGKPNQFPFLVAGYFGFLVLLLLIQKRLVLSKICTRCGRPACRRCNIELKDNTVCGQCFHVFVRKEKIDSKSRISKELQIRRFLKGQESITRGINFILPGTGQLIRGRTVRGVLFLLVPSVMLVQILLGDGLLRSSASIGGRVDWLFLTPLLGVVAACYTWAVVDGFRRDN
jgi:tetratricopeptide (TPR) repeat protein